MPTRPGHKRGDMSVPTRFAPAFSLAPLTLPQHRPAAFLRCAARAGFRQVALRLIGGDPHDPPVDMAPLVRSERELAEVRAILAGEGLAIREIEVLMLEPHTDVAASRPMIETAAMLGARHLVVCVGDPDLSRAADLLAAAVLLARAHGLLIELEFLPYTALKTIDAAAALIEASKAADVGILVDALHLTRSGGGAIDVARQLPDRLRCLQLCDAPLARPADLIGESRGHRLAPGSGWIDLAALVRAMPEGTAISIEAPNVGREAEIGPLAHIAELKHAAERLIERIEERA